jgi:LysM repeat protein
MVVEDRIITSAEVNYNLIYSGGNAVHSKKGTIPFNHFIDMPGAHKELSGEVEFQVVEGSYEVMGNDLGERKIIDLEVKIKVLGKAYEDNQRELIIDAYSTKENIHLEREELSIKENLKDISHTQKLNIEVPEIYAKDIIEVLGTANIMENKYVDDNIVVDGYLTVEVLYIDRLTNELGSFKDDFPFRSEIDEKLSYDTNFDVEVKLDSISGFARKDNLDIEGSILVKLLLSKNRKVYAIKEVKETGELINKKSKPSITIYIVQKEDVLWDIAKRYNTTIDEIVTSNNLPSRVVAPGDKIIIEKKVESISI